MDYLEVINQYSLEKSLDEFPLADKDKNFIPSVSYDLLYSEFSKLNKNQKFSSYQKIIIDGSGRELLEIFTFWAQGKIPVLDSRPGKHHGWELPLFWEVKNIINMFILSFNKKLVATKAKINNENIPCIKTGIRVRIVKNNAGPAAFLPLSCTPANLNEDLFGLEIL